MADESKERYINPYTDFGFKKLFGTEMNKDLLWLFDLRNLSRLLERPAALQERVFEKLFKQAEIAKFTPEELQDYEESVKIYRDLKNSIASAERRGWMKRTVEIAKNLKASGMPVQQIADMTELSISEVEAL